MTPLFRRISLTAAAAALAAAPLATGTALAAAPQDGAGNPAPAAPAQAAPAAAPAPSTPEGKARALLQKMAGAYRDLKTFSATLDVKAVRSGKPASSVVTKITFGRESGARVVTLAGSKVATTVFDGTKLYATDSTDLKQYVVEKPGTIAAGLAEATGDAGLGLLGILLTSPDAGPKVLPPAAVNVALEPKGPTVGGVKTQLVSAQFTAPSDPSAASALPAIVTVEIAIGKDDSLLRRLTVTQSAPGGGAAMVATETYTDVKANPVLAPDAFKFTPPAGAVAKDVTEAEPLPDKPAAAPATESKPAEKAP